MNPIDKIDESTVQKPLRLWPGILLVIFQWLAWSIIPKIVPEFSIFGIFVGLLGGLAIVIWWAFFSRAPQVERWGAVIFMAVTLYITSLLIHKSIATGGQGMMFVIYAIPTTSLAFVVWAVASQKLSTKIRRWSLVATIILACGVWTLFRIDGITGDFNLDLAWRWTETSEERLMAQSVDKQMAQTPAQIAMNTVAEWPGFRGPNRDGVVWDVKIETDWSTTPPKELWRRSIGPGCSSFAVIGGFLYTQEQRGEDEVVSCYTMDTGKPVWKHHDKARFWDSHAGAGPRSTPTVSNARVYTLGATGILNTLNAEDGTKLWSRNTVADTQRKHSGWGYSSSPLVVNDVVIVAVVGQLVAYDLATGDPRWFGPDGGDSYSSPHLLTIDGITQVLLMSGTGVSSFIPDDGTLLWEYSWPGDSRILQPAVTPDGDILIGKGDGSALRRIGVLNKSTGWSFEERWTSSRLKPNFNDFVVHKSHAYGFNGPMLVCIDVKDGKRKWRGGRYGGQIILLANQDLLLILSEKGELALVKANSEKFSELARMDAIEGKTWNHPVLAGDVLLVRNSQEMVAYQLIMAED